MALGSGEAGRSGVAALPAAAAVGVVPAVVPERAAADGVDDDDEDEEDDVDDGDALPVALEGGHHAGLAGLAVVAERLVAPGAAVRVRRRADRGGLGPVRAVHVGEVAAGGGLAAAGLHERQQTGGQPLIETGCRKCSGKRDEAR